MFSCWTSPPLASAREGGHSRRVAGVASQGRAVVLSSSDAEELCAVCDRVLVMRHGVVRSVLTKSELSVARIVTETIRDTADDADKAIQ